MNTHGKAIFGAERLLPGRQPKELIASPRHEALDWYLTGVFETNWSTRAATSMKYGKAEIAAVTGSRWRKLALEAVRYEGNDAILVFRDRVVPAKQCLAFSYRDGRVVLHDSIMGEGSGPTPVRIELPLARQVAAPGVVFEEIVLTIPGK